MSDQEMLDAIDAEIEAVRVANTRIRLNGPGASETICAPSPASCRLWCVGT